MPRGLINAERDGLNTEGHLLIDKLLELFDEWQIRRAVSRHVGVYWIKNRHDSGFHFSHHHPIATVKKALTFLRAAVNQRKLKPRINAIEENLTQEIMMEALGRLPKHAPLPWYRRIFYRVSSFLT